MLKIGVIGCGAIGARICKAIDNGSINAYLVAIHDRSDEHVKDFWNHSKINHLYPRP